jgi:hypothetical protein
VPFADEPQLRYVGLGWYELTRPAIYVDGDTVITIPTGTRTDLASVPRIFWWFIPPTGAYEHAAVVHDDGCTECRRAHDEGRPPRQPPRDVDRLFVRILCEADAHADEVGDDKARIPRFTRHCLWVGVRWGALFNPARRAGWWRDAPAVVGSTLLLLAAVAAVVYGLDLLAHWIV